MKNGIIDAHQPLWFDAIQQQDLQTSRIYLNGLNQDKEAKQLLMKKNAGLLLRTAMWFYTITKRGIWTMFRWVLPTAGTYNVQLYVIWTARERKTLTV